MRKQFIAFADHLMETEEMFFEMARTTEGSMHHREANVLVHTQMVLDQYYNLTPADWNISHVEGAFACLFHDVGKPEAEVDKFSEERGAYHSYPGHEIISARAWENWIVENLAQVVLLFPTFCDRGFQSIFNVGWMVEHHLPYCVTNKYKLECIFKTGKSIGGNTFANVLVADGKGRINDNEEAQAIRMQTWMDAYEAYEYVPYVQHNNGKHLHMFIGPSGVGKSTVITSIISGWDSNIVSVFSLDQLQLNWYADLLIMHEPTRYERAHEAAAADPLFQRRWQQEYIKLIKSSVDLIIIDGTNLTTKHRRFFLDAAKSNKRETHAAYMTSSLSILEEQQLTRVDKFVTQDVVRKQHAITQYPSYHEFDVIHLM